MWSPYLLYFSDPECFFFISWSSKIWSHIVWSCPKRGHSHYFWNTEAMRLLSFIYLFFSGWCKFKYGRSKKMAESLCKMSAMCKFFWLQGYKVSPRRVFHHLIVGSPSKNNPSGTFDEKMKMSPISAYISAKCSNLRLQGGMEFRPDRGDMFGNLPKLAKKKKKKFCTKGGIISDWPRAGCKWEHMLTLQKPGSLQPCAVWHKIQLWKYKTKTSCFHRDFFVWALILGICST